MSNPEAWTEWAPFEDLDPAAATDLAAATEVVVLADGEVLFREGDEARYLFGIAAGIVRATRRRNDGDEVEVHRLEAGDFAGLTSLFVDQTRSATLTARGEVRCLRIAKVDLLAAFAKHPSVATSLIRCLSRRFRTDSATIAQLIKRDLGDRCPVAVFDAKGYDRKSFIARMPDRVALEFFEARLDRSTASLATGFPVVCAFVNDRIDADTIAALAGGGTRLIAMRCAGYNNVDLKAAEDHSIAVVRVPAYSPYAVAEHAMALAQTLNRRIHRAYNRVREGNFTLDHLVGRDLHGRTAGILGVGKIGQCMARICRGYGMRVIGWDAFPNQAFADEIGMTFVEREVVFAESDLLSLHAPLLPDTHHLIDAEAITLMRPGVLIVNTSRGGLIDTGALIDGLRSGRVGGAGLDVYEEEEGYFFQDHSTHAIDDPDLLHLISNPNVLVTSHQAFLTEDALANIADTTAGNIIAFLDGEDLANKVG